ncbi:MAG TPA: glycosyl transferase family 1 [Cyanobacteria bacterium UBA8803]|nr:glycosyl transferase family 1 [Cyanobacteria bacterium UBA9273]HBL62835.1 glycosyl transferase family 1 [Cyanobacteria bacterium UBA8803]
MKLLLSAYACEPGVGSEPGKGWNMAREMAKYHEVWVLTWSGRRPGIEMEIARNPVPNLHVIYYGWPGDRLWRGGIGLYLHYYLWQIAAYFVARQLHREINFDLVHHISYASYWMPSFLPLLPVPFVWGPVGGGESAPKTFRPDFSWWGKAYELLRDLSQWLGEANPFVRLALQRSAVVLVPTEDTAQRLRSLGRQDVQVFLHTALPEEEISCLGQYKLPESNPIRFISIGRLLHWKGFHLGLRAFAAAKLDGAEYWIIGDGAESKRLQRLARDLGIASQVKFWGKLPRDETLRKLGECHVLVHPSLHDSGGTGCLEAMLAGRPVICLDLGGPAILIAQETGYKIPAQDPERAVQDLAESMTRLALDPKLRVSLGQAAQKRGSEIFSWNVKGKFYNQLYEEILAKRTSQQII